MDQHATAGLPHGYRYSPPTTHHHTLDNGLTTIIECCHDVFLSTTDSSASVLRAPERITSRDKGHRAEDEPCCPSSALADLLVFQIKSPAETLNPASAVEDTLRSGKERVALRADIHAKILPDAPCLKRIATGARHRRFNKVGVNTSFHSFYSCPFRRNDLLQETGAHPARARTIPQEATTFNGIVHVASPAVKRRQISINSSLPPEAVFRHTAGAVTSTRSRSESSALVFCCPSCPVSPQRDTSFIVSHPTKGTRQPGQPGPRSGISS